MKTEELSELTNQELLDKKKSSKSSKIISAVLIGALIGVATYNAAKSGSLIITFLLLGFALFLGSRWNKNDKALEQELETRGLK